MGVFGSDFISHSRNHRSYVTALALTANWEETVTREEIMAEELPSPDMDTTRRLAGVAAIDGARAAGETSSEIMSAVVCFLIGGLGATETAGILRQWADKVERREASINAVWN